MNLREVAADYAGLGYAPIPLKPGTSKPACKGYPTLPIPLQWADVGDGANIGLLAGDGIAFLDLDEKNRAGSVAAGLRYFGSLGYYPGDFPHVKTPTGGAHLYLMFAGGIPRNVRILARDFAAGEFRFGPSAFVAAPPSVRDGRQYELVGGDLRQLPRLDLDDVLPILQNKDTGESDLAAAILATAPSGELGHIGRGTWRLLRGDGCDRYPSRSEAEAAILAGLCNAGLSFGAILELFLTYPAAGKFAELYAVNPDKGIGYLRRSWEAAQRWAAARPSEGRKRAFYAVLWAQASPWPGRNGRTDHAAFLANALTAYDCGKLEYGLSVRELAERGGMGRLAAGKAQSRLLAAGHVERVKEFVMNKSVRYRLPQLRQSDKLAPLPHTPPCEGVVSVCHFGDGDKAAIPDFAHDAFRYRGLGKTAAELYAVLRDKPMTAGELAAATGRNLRTVFRNLARLARVVDIDTGEVFKLAEPGDGDTWRAVDTDLAAVARAVGTAGVGERQRAKHAAERAGFKLAIARAQAGTTPTGEDKE